MFWLLSRFKIRSDNTSYSSRFVGAAPASQGFVKVMPNHRKPCEM
jgi:hypothetical protein